MKKKYIIFFVFCNYLCFPQENIKFSETIVVDELKKHLKVLASDSLEGRENGKPGQ